MHKIIASLCALILLAAFCLAAEKPVSDDRLYDEVRIKLTSDPVVKGGGIQVDVKQGIVTLSGTVESNKQKDKATHVAKKVKGVKEVVNNIEVKTGSGAK
jgi:hyperosmotically inducible protein